MTQLDHRTYAPGTLCASCIHRNQPASWCRKFVRTLQSNPPAVLTCTGHRKAADLDRVLIAGTWLLLVGLLSFSLFGAPAPADGQGGGYPPPYYTATWPATWPVWTPGAPTNTPVPGPGPMWTAEVTPVVEAWRVAEWVVWLTCVEVGR